MNEAVAVIALIGAVWLAIHAVQGRSRIGRVLAAVGCLLFLIPPAYVVQGFFPWLFDARFRTFRSFFQSIEPGMTKEDLERVLARHYPAGGPRLAPKFFSGSGGAWVYHMNPETSREPNCEGVVVWMVDGRVTRKVYSPD